MKLKHRGLLTVLFNILLIILVGAFIYLNFILSDTLDTEKQALPEPSETTEIAAGEWPSELNFPGPMLYLDSTDGWQMTGGKSWDTPFADGVARVAELTWEDDRGRKLVCTTIYPARAVSLITRDGYTLASAETVEVNGISMLEMLGSDGTTRLHGAGSKCAYMLTAPMLPGSELDALVEQCVFVSKSQNN